MRFYLVQGIAVNPGDPEDIHVSTKADAIVQVKRLEPVWRSGVIVQEVEVPTDKENLLRLLNNQGGSHEYLRRWRGTARGGLKEVVMA